MNGGVCTTVAIKPPPSRVKVCPLVAALATASSVEPPQLSAARVGCTSGRLCSGLGEAEPYDQRCNRSQNHCSDDPSLGVRQDREDARSASCPPDSQDDERGPNQTDEVARSVNKPNGHEAVMLAGRNQFCESSRNADDRPPRKLEADNASQRCGNRHDGEKPQNRLEHTRNWNGRQTFRLGDQCKENAQKGTNADCCGNAPADSKDGRRSRVKQGRMPNREVFDAKTGRDLIVYDAVGDCGDSAEQNDLSLFAR